MPQRSIEFPNHVHVAPHLAESEDLSPKGALHMLAGELRGPLEDVNRTCEGLGH